MEALWNFASFLVGIGILVTVHEFGHFWVARRCNVKVEQFSIGFGKKIWSKKGKNGTLYSISLIPLGGYVKMLDERVAPVPNLEKKHAFNNRPLYQRAAIVAAGPMANFIFAIICYWLIFIIGMPVIKPVIGQVKSQSIAFNMGFKPGMRIDSIGGMQTNDWNEVNLALSTKIGEPNTLFKVSANNGTLQQELLVDLQQWKYNPETEYPYTSLGIYPYHPKILTTIAYVEKKSPAARADLKIGDKILTLNGKKVNAWNDFVTIIHSRVGQNTKLVILRNEQKVNLNITPVGKMRNGLEVGYVGIAPKMAAWPDEYKGNIKYNIFVSLGKSLEKTNQLIKANLNMFAKMFSGDVALKNLGGPISIAKGAGVTASYGIVSFMGFLALISIGLGIVNLLPLPVLDGGHLLFFGIEAIIQRPVPDKIQSFCFRIGAILLMIIMAIAIFNDFARL